MEKNTNTIVFGCQGLVGRAFWKFYRKQRPDSAGTHYRPTSDALQFDLERPDLTVLQLPWSTYRYGMIAAALPRIGYCEKEPVKSRRVNLESTLQLGCEIAERGLTPVFFSSDYVFDGKSGFYDENSPLNPLNEYGRQKAELERRIPELFGNNYLLLRLGKVFSLEKGDRSLFDEMASLWSERKPVQAAADQIFSPIFLDDALEAVSLLQQKNCRGLYNICGKETASRYQFAQELQNAMQIAGLLKTISLDDLGESFLRPKNTSMINRKLLQDSGVAMKPLKECLQKIVANYNP